MSEGRQHYHNAINRFEPLSREEVTTLYELIDHGSDFEQQWARNKMIEHNLRLVVKVVSTYRLDDDIIEDAIQEGNQGLMRAVDKFDPSTGFAFSTYATNWIRYRVSFYLREHAHVVKIPVDTQKANSKVVMAQRELSSRMDESDITSSVLAEHLGMSVEEVETSLSLVQPKVYLDAQLRSDGTGGNHYEYYGDKVDYEATLEKSIQYEQAVERINGLHPKERDMLCRYYGINCKEQNYREIAEAHGLTRQRVEQIVSKANEKLRDLLDVMGIQAA